MNADSGIVLAERFFSGTGFSYDRIVNIWTLGFDRWWKRRIVGKIPANPTQIMDQASGTGILTFKIAQKFPHCKVIGVELRKEYLAIADKKARQLNVGNVEFILGRAEDVFVEGSIDCITSSYLAKYADINSWLNNNSKMLRKGGLLIVHDFTYPSNRFFAAFWEAFFRIMQAFGSRISPEWKIVFDELPNFLRKTQWVQELTDSLTAHGFSEVHPEFLTFGTSAIITAKKVD